MRTVTPTPTLSVSAEPSLLDGLMVSVNVSVPDPHPGDYLPRDVCLIVAGDGDNVDSLCAKLVAVAGQRVALVLTDDSDEFDSPMTMHLLARVAKRESVRLAVVTRRPWARHWAEDEGILTFDRQRDVPRVVDDRTFNLIRLLHLILDETVAAGRGLLRWLLTMLIVVVLAALGIVLIPKATVTVVPKTVPLQSTIKIQASTDVTSLDLASKVVPGRTVYFVLDENGTLPIERSNHPLDGRAVGIVTFENRTADSVPIPSGTIVSTFTGHQFATQKAVVLANHAGAWATVPIKAVFPGGGENVNRGEIVVVGGALHWEVTLVNEEAIGGGGPVGAPVVTSLDTQAVLAQVTSQAQRHATAELARQTTSDELAVPESVQITPIDETFDHKVGDETKTIGVHVTFRVEALIINRAQVNTIAIKTWQPSIPAGFTLDSSSIQVGQPVVADAGPSITTFNVPISAIAFSAVNADRITEYVRLQSPAVAAQAVDRTFNLAAPTDVTIVPNWLGRAYRVDVVIDPNPTSRSNQADDSEVPAT